MDGVAADVEMEKTVLPAVILAYDGIAADEAGVVAEVLTNAGTPVIVAAVQVHDVTSFHGKVRASRSADELGPCSALIVPGGMGVRTAAADERLLESVRNLASQSTWLGATSTGSVLLAAAGLANGARATTHWLAQDLLEMWGITPVDQPFVEHGRLLTASGLGSSATLAFRLVGALHGVEAEQRARDRYRSSSTPTPPRGQRFWGWGKRRHRIVERPEPAFVDRASEVVLLDLDARSER
ncbi:MAG: DJ-1/PfpI family protein [Acidimicrobiales bacterium]